MSEGKIAAPGVNHDIKIKYTIFWDKKSKYSSFVEKRFLTLYGKSYIVKSVGFSTLLYSFNVLQLPECVITNAEQAIWDFIWDGKPDKVERDVCRERCV